MVCLFVFFSLILTQTHKELLISRQRYHEIEREFTRHNNFHLLYRRNKKQKKKENKKQLKQ